LCLWRVQLFLPHQLHFCGLEKQSLLNRSQSSTTTMKLFITFFTAFASLVLAAAVPPETPNKSPQQVSLPVQGGTISSQGFIGSTKTNAELDGLKDPFNMNIPTSYNRHRESVPVFKKAECSCAPASCPSDYVKNVDDCKSAHAWACYRKSAGVCAMPTLRVSPIPNNLAPRG
jgi:hypothetical protein